MAFRTAPQCPIAVPPLPDSLPQISTSRNPYGVVLARSEVPLYPGELETLIATLMVDIYQLSLTGVGKDGKMRLVTLECRAVGTL